MEEHEKREEHEEHALQPDGGLGSKLPRAEDGA